MKLKKITSFIACVLAAVMLVVCFSSCSSGDKVLMQYKGSKLTSSMYSYMLSSQKAYIKYTFDYYNSYYYYYTGKYYFDTDFDTYLASATKDEAGNTITYGESFENTVISAAKMFVIINSLCDTYKLGVTDTSALDSVESYIDADISAAGSEYYLNIILADLGASIKTEREYLMNQAKVTALYDYLYGTSGTQKLDDSVIIDYFNKNYKKCDYVLYPFYQTTEETTSTKLVEDKDITDERIEQYFTDNYEKFQHVLFYFYNTATSSKISEEDMETKRAAANELYTKLTNGEITFEEAQTQYNEDPGVVKAAEGLCITAGTMKDDNVYDKLKTMNDGEYALVESDIGVHIVKKVAVDDDDSASFKTEITKTLTIKDVTDAANAFYESFKDGTKTFESADGYGKYGESTCYVDGELDETLEKELATLTAAGDSKILTMDDGVYILRKLDTDDDDYKKYFDTIYKQLAEDEFYEYIESLYPEVTVDEEELAKFSFIACKPLDISDFDSLISEESQTSK